MVDIPEEFFNSYSGELAKLLAEFDWTPVKELTNDLLDCWKTGRQVFIAGNGGSAGNANHIANDLIYPISKKFGSGIRIHSLSANPSIITCLGNDEGYSEVFSYQLGVLAREGDIFIALSGSGNSRNILKALEFANKNKIKTYSILGYSGGEAKNITKTPIHFQCSDMQIVEDCQTIVFHMIMQWLRRYSFIALDHSVDTVE
ncbi:MAG: SIS domain-containing protein [Alphaproteobacteria bacterium]